MLKNELQRIIKQQQIDLIRNLGVKRDFKVKILEKFVTIISGVRRCGKSTLVKQYLKDKTPVYYVYYEDISLTDFKLKDFLKLEELFTQEFGPHGIYFFDEVQNIDGWEKYVRSLVDKGERVIITGSNASMLSRELGTRLTGRHITLELYPFSYNEFLRLKSVKHSTEIFKLYIKQGGFPEYLKSNDLDVLRNLFWDVFFRDVLVRNDFRNELALKSMLLFLLSNIGKEITYNKLKQYIGVRSGNTVAQFMNGFEDAYLLFSVKQFDYSVKKQMVNPKKIYCIDNSLISTNAFSFSENKGRMLENLVYIELKRKNKEIFYHKEIGECDFLVKEKLKIVEAIQVCYNLNEDNKERELTGLLDALDKYNLKFGMILTFNQEDELRINKKRIIIKPTWKWLLE